MSMELVRQHTDAALTVLNAAAAALVKAAAQTEAAQAALAAASATLINAEAQLRAREAELNERGRQLGDDGDMQNESSSSGVSFTESEHERCPWLVPMDGPKPDPWSNSSSSSLQQPPKSAAWTSCGKPNSLFYDGESPPTSVRSNTADTTQRVRVKVFSAGVDRRYRGPAAGTPPPAPPPPPKPPAKTAAIAATAAAASVPPPAPPPPPNTRP